MQSPSPESRRPPSARSRQPTQLQLDLPPLQGRYGMVYLQIPLHLTMLQQVQQGLHTVLCVVLIKNLNKIHRNKLSNL